jgi:hypothetical protein
MEKPVKILIILFALFACAAMLLFAFLDIMFLIELANTGQNGTFETYSTLTPDQDFWSTFGFLCELNSLYFPGRFPSEETLYAHHFLRRFDLISIVFSMVVLDRHYNNRSMIQLSLRKTN